MYKAEMITIRLTLNVGIPIEKISTGNRRSGALMLPPYTTAVLHII